MRISDWSSDVCSSDLIPQGSISPWATGTYQGNGQNIAKKVYKYRQTLETQAARAATAQNAGLSNEPDYVETRTGRILRGLMITAHAGEITYAATGPGLGKTKTACHYAASTANAFMVTINPSIDSVTSLPAPNTPPPGNNQNRH